MTMQPKLYAPPIDLDRRDKYARIASSRLGVAGNTHTFLFDDFDKIVGGTFVNTPNGWSQELSGTGAEALSGLNAHGGGSAQISSGATAGGQAVHQSYAPLIRDVSTTRWYMNTRFRLQTAVDNQARAFVGTFNKANTRTHGVGFCGPLSAANFVFTYDGTYTAGSFRDTGIAVDQNWHFAEWWVLADGIMRMTFDGTLLNSVTFASAPTDSNHLLHIVLNGTTAANRILEVDWISCMYAHI